VVEPESVGRILLDAARLIGQGEVVVFGSAALAMWIEKAPRTKDIDIWCDPPERGELVEALMGIESWYHETHGVYVEVWAPETFVAPSDWRSRARSLRDDTVPGVHLVVPHPHDVLLAKLERWEQADREHARLILAAIPLDRPSLDGLVSRSPYRSVGFDAGRVAAFEAHLEALRFMVG
jgi:hypothetical protein